MEQEMLLKSLLSDGDDEACAMREGGRDFSDRKRSVGRV